MTIDYLVPYAQDAWLAFMAAYAFTGRARHLVYALVALCIGLAPVLTNPAYAEMLLDL
jgi:hypothetical protein